MRFYDRNDELKALGTMLEQSRFESRMTVVMGRRRIGKTELVNRCGDSTILYFFVSRKAVALLCEDFVREAEDKLQLPMGRPTRFSDLFRLLLHTAEQRQYPPSRDAIISHHAIFPIHKRRPQPAGRGIRSRLWDILLYHGMPVHWTAYMCSE